MCSRLYLRKFSVVVRHGHSTSRMIPLKNQIYLGVFGCVGCSEFVPRHILSENMFFVNQAFEEKCQDLKTKRKCLTETPFTTKHIKDMYIFLCEKLFVSIIVVSISVKPLKSSRAKAIIHWISSLGLIRYFFPTLSDIDMYNGSKIKGEYIMWIFRVSVFINSRDFHYLNSE